MYILSETETKCVKTTSFTNIHSILVCDYIKFALDSEIRFSSLPHVWSAWFSIRKNIGSTPHIIYNIVKKNILANLYMHIQHI